MSVSSIVVWLNEVMRWRDGNRMKAVLTSLVLSATPVLEDLPCVYDRFPMLSSMSVAVGRLSRISSVATDTGSVKRLGPALPGLT
jgi:hypothetical protein